MKSNFKMLAILLRDLTITPEECEVIFGDPSVDFMVVIHQLNIVYNKDINLYYRFIKQLNSIHNVKNKYQYDALINFNKNNIYDMIMIMLSGDKFEVDFTMKMVPKETLNGMFIQYQMIPEYNYTLKRKPINKFTKLIDELKLSLGTKTQVEEGVRQEYIDQLIEDNTLMEDLLKVYKTKPLTFHLSLVYFHMYDIMSKNFDHLKTMVPYMLEGKICEIVYRKMYIDDNIVTLNEPVIIMKDYCK